MTKKTPYIGFVIPILAKTIFQRALTENRFAPDSIHNDDYTRRSGYPGALVSAYVLAGYMSEPMVHLFGESWFTRGKISLTFIGKGVQQGDAVTIGGRVTDSKPAPDGSEVHLELWMEKAAGTRPVVGRASGLIADSWPG